MTARSQQAKEWSGAHAEAIHDLETGIRDGERQAATAGAAVISEGTRVLGNLPTTVPGAIGVASTVGP